MHLVLPFASAATPAASQALAAVGASGAPLAQLPDLPHLTRLLALPAEVTRNEGDAWSFSPPHERVQAAAWGWVQADGLLPFAALAARADGLAVESAHNPADTATGWGLLSPAHWHLGTDQVSLGNPDALALDEATSRALLDALRPLFDDDGWALEWGAPTRWYARHASLVSLPTAALDRVIGRNVDRWLGPPAQARTLRRRQAEAQMLLHTHPINAAREAAGAWPVNSFWLSGTGPTQAPASGPGSGPAMTVDSRLRAAALDGNGSAWAQAWQALDAGPVAALLDAALAGEPVRCTLCGERHAHTLAPHAPAWWQRGPLARRRVDLPALLASL